jgi:flagellar biosynthesis/type III secretory pathway M-ring protein FliF/YscJ
MYILLITIIIILVVWNHFEEKRTIKLAKYLREQRYQMYLQELEAKNIKRKLDESKKI